MKPLECFASVIRRWEGEWQDNPDDTGNYWRASDGRNILIGTMRGITPSTYAAWSGATPTADVMRSISEDDAAAIYSELYYERYGFELLPWSAPVAAAADMAFNSGPGIAVRTLQSIIGAMTDGEIGPRTVVAFSHMLTESGAEHLAVRFAQARCNWLRSHHIDGRLLPGLIARANWFTPANKAWWAEWDNQPNISA